MQELLQVFQLPILLILIFFEFFHCLHACTDVLAKSAIKPQAYGFGKFEEVCGEMCCPRMFKDKLLGKHSSCKCYSKADLVPVEMFQTG